MTSEELCLLIERNVRGIGEEAYVQIALQRLFTKQKIAHERERWLSKKDRIDFLIGTVGVEVKVRGGLAAVISQLERYAASDLVSSLVLVSTKSTLCRVPTVLNGKPVHAAAILAGIV